GHKVLAGVLLREYEKDGGLLRGKILGVDGTVKAEDLLKLRIQEGIEAGQDGGHDGIHRLLRSGQGRAGKPPCLMGVRQFIHENMKACFPLGLAGGQQILHQFEHADDVPPLLRGLVCGRQVLCQQKDNGGEQALCRVIKECVLPVVRGVPLRVDDGLCKDLGVLLRLGAGGQVLLILTTDIHVVVDEGQQIVSIRASGVAQIDDRHLIAVASGGNGPVVPGQVS
ncbi:Crp/Fnr family transcriptional regulator, partial [Dysosmobacter welbionis]